MYDSLKSIVLLKGLSGSFFGFNATVSKSSAFDATIERIVSVKLPHRPVRRAVRTFLSEMLFSASFTWKLVF